jgi:hypothetical protein
VTHYVGITEQCRDATEERGELETVRGLLLIREEACCEVVC